MMPFSGHVGLQLEVGKRAAAARREVVERGR